MLTISLDEYGDFEGLKGKNEPVYIAGVIYDDLGDKSDRDNERKRIQSYYETVIGDALKNEKAKKEKAQPGGGAVFQSSYGSDFVFPKALHSVGDRFKDTNVVRPVKQQVSATFGEFIRKGSYQGNPLSYKNSQSRRVTFKPRKGHYYLFVILKSDRGMRRLLAPNASILAKDDYASNLYFHMVEELLSKLLFHNPILGDVPDVWLDIATRRSGNLAKTDQLFQDYEKIGYKPQTKNNPSHFSLTNGDVYRSVLANEIIRSGKTKINIESFKVVPIEYKKDGKGMEFLYLADSICSILGYRIPGSGSDDWLREIIQKTEQIVDPASLYKSKKIEANSNPILSDSLFIFGYDEIDLLYQKAYSCYEEGDYYTALSHIFEGKKETGAFASLYNDAWFRRLEDSIAGSKNEEAVILAVRELHHSILSNRFDQDRSIFILKVLEKAAAQVKDSFHTPETRKVLYELYDAGMSFYTHIGDSGNAAPYFDKCVELAGLVSLEDFLSTRNRMVVCCCDSFDFDKANEIVEENVNYQELLSDMKKEVRIAQVQEEGTVSLGKAYSQEGQVLAFKRDARAEELFHEAMKRFDPSSANYRITQSYLLHFYLDQEENKKSLPQGQGDRNNASALTESAFRERFLEEAKSYFGGNESLFGQLKYILDEGTGQDPLFNLKYALYVFTRSVYTYRISEVKETFLKKLRSVETDIAKKLKDEKWTLSGHPAELIFMYLSLIEQSVGDPDIAQKYEDRIDTCLRYKGSTEDVICRFGHARCEDKKGNTDRRDALSVELCEDMFKKYSALKNETLPETGQFEWLKEHITFMYC